MKKWKLLGIVFLAAVFALSAVSGFAASQKFAGVKLRAAMIDEEASLMAAPKKEDVAAAREKIVSTLREMNSKGELAFIEE